MLGGMHSSSHARLTFSFAYPQGIFLALVICLSAAMAQAPRAQLKPTELVVKHYEKLILRGTLLTPEGWKLASELFTAADPYPQNGEIRVIWTGTNVLGEDWNDGSRSQVSTKWNDWYGTIDSALRFKPASSGAVAMAEIFSLTCLQDGTDNETGSGTSGPCRGKWKIAETLRYRCADIPQAIRYVEEMRDRTDDPEIRKNAARTIAALKRLNTSCRSASAC
jgi:hypothetical protein